MIYRKATQADLEYVKQNPFELAVRGYPDMEIPDENCYTVFCEDEILGVGGLVLKWEGVGLLWLMCTADFKKVGHIAAFHAIQEIMEYVIKDNNLWRAEAAVRTDFPIAIRMVEFFGYKREGLMKKYCPDKGDAFLYARIE